jgi:hypothetical protein
MPTLVIFVECKDQSDLDWLRHKCVSAVESEVGEAEDENRLDGEVAVGWEIED